MKPEARKKYQAIERFAGKMALAYTEAKKPDVEARLYVDTQDEVHLAHAQLLIILSELDELDLEKTVRAPSIPGRKAIELRNGSVIMVSIKPELLTRPRGLK